MKKKDFRHSIRQFASDLFGASSSDQQAPNDSDSEYVQVGPNETLGLDDPARSLATMMPAVPPDGAETAPSEITPDERPRRARKRRRRDTDSLWPGSRTTSRPYEILADAILHRAIVDARGGHHPDALTFLVDEGGPEGKWRMELAEFNGIDDSALRAAGRRLSALTGPSPSPGES